MKVAEVWVCPDCGFRYESPLKVNNVSHDCPERRAKLPASRGHGSQFKKEVKDAAADR